MSLKNNSDYRQTHSRPMNNTLEQLQNGQCHDPFSVLGHHTDASGQTLVRAFLPHAESVELDGIGSMQRREGSDIFELSLDKEIDLAPHYQLIWQEQGSGQTHTTISPYSFTPQVGELDLHLFAQGKHHHAYRFLGAHHQEIDGINGYQFAVWVPGAARVSLVGDFNAWDGRRHPMRCRGESGVWELFVPGLCAGDSYKYDILTRHGEAIQKTDPYARSMALRPDTTSNLVALQEYEWQDQPWLDHRENHDWKHAPLSIYECHAGSWQRDEDNGFLNWRELASRLIPYVAGLGYTHIELLPITEYPLDQSWGYQVSGYFAPTSRYGSADDFRYFVDQCHQHKLGVILDWVPAHFPKDDFALARFNGEPLYEHADPQRGEHKDWGTLIFDYGRNEVRNFLLTNAVYWLSEFHLDGLRVDAVASMLYLDYSREAGEWTPNEHGGRENLDALAFIREMNTIVHQLHPGVLTFAEESTAWPMVSRPIEMGGLGFSLKWNMGWMNDNLSYIEEEPVHRKYHHQHLTFSQLYAYAENFVLPLSHDEVVHGKHSLVDKMPGDHWQKMANLRLFYAWQYAHPGKKLLFMGGEIAQWLEWNEMAQLDWALLDQPQHQGIHRLVGRLNQLHRKIPALHELDFSAEGFQWLDCNDQDQSVIALVRYARDAQEMVLCILNFTPVPRHHYRIGVPIHAHFEEILNTDSDWYGGSNAGNLGTIQCQDHPWMGFPHSIELTLPPLAAVYLKPG